MSFLAIGWVYQLLEGMAMTLAVAVLSFVAGLVFGTLFAFAKLGGGRVLRAIADVYTTITRGVPELLIIFLFYFGGSSAAMAVAKLFGYDGYVELNAFTIGVISIGLISGAYSTEVIRAAIRAVPPGQIEAGRAIGMGPFLVLRRILLPQTLFYALPGLGNVWQETLKDTSLISVTGLVEIMRVAGVGAAATHEPFVFYIAAVVLYLVLTTASGSLFQRAEAYYGRGVRRA